MKRFIITVLIVFMMPYPQPVQAVSAQRYCVRDVASSRVLMSQRADEPAPMASLTKVMTAIVALEERPLTTVVTVTKEMVQVEGSSIYLRVGERRTLRELVYGLMLRSGNDAALAIAIAVGGSVEGFVRLMNERVRFLQLTHTHFQNPHGLDAADHYTTACEMATIFAYGLRNEAFRTIVDTKQYKTWRNKHKLVVRNAAVIGGKTGYTKRTGRTLVTAFRHRQQETVVVTLQASDDWRDHEWLVRQAVARYPLRTLLHKGKLPHRSLYLQTALVYPLRRGEEEDYVLVYHLAKRPEQHLAGYVTLQTRRGVIVQHQWLYRRGGGLE